MELVGAKRFLNDEEIEKLCSMCNEFGLVFPTEFPGKSIKRKMHKLIFNVPKFVRRFRTIGLFSEQEDESKHNAVNQELRTLACVKDRAVTFSNGKGRATFKLLKA